MAENELLKIIKNEYRNYKIISEEYIKSEDLFNGSYKISFETKEYVHASISKIAEMYPNLCTMYIRETTGMAELRLKDTRPVGASLQNFF